MIIISLSGGLGNQMFQYAFGKSVVRKYNQEMTLDLSFSHRNFDEATTPRTYALGCYKLDSKVKTIDSGPVLLKGQLGRVSKALHRINPRKFYGVVEEGAFEYNASHQQHPGSNLYIGYWQSYKYLHDIKDELSRDFQIKAALSAMNAGYLEEIESYNAVGLHIRRSDYVSNKGAASYHGVCSLDYYEQALEHICEKVNDPKLFVFSDDIEWVKDNLKTELPIAYITGNDGAPEVDIFLFSKCKHYIIANSSFSWWGTFLGQNKDSVAIRPRQWFAKNNERTRDLCPENWKAL